jgi:hypothetical protein
MPSLDLVSLNALTKQVYADKVADLIPDYEPLLTDVPFVASDKQNGGEYNQPVLLSNDFGFTYLGSYDNQINLEEPVIRQSANAKVLGSALMGRTYITQVAASRIKGNSKRAFVDATKYAVESLVKSTSSVVETSYWYGGSGLATGQFASAGDLTNKIFTITAAEFAEALWMGALGRPIEIRTGGTIIATAKVTKIDMENRQITVDTAGSAAHSTTYSVWAKGSYGMECNGVYKILSNTGSLFGIDAAQYDLWKANQVNVAGNLTFSAVALAVANATARGVRGKLKGYVHPLAFQTMIPDYVALKEAGIMKSRTFNQADEIQNLVHGTKTIKFYVNSVEVEFLASNYVKRGYAFLLSSDEWLRIGSSPITFDMPGMPETGEYWRLMESKASVELRIWSDSAIFTAKPATNILLTGITT